MMKLIVAAYIVLNALWWSVLVALSAAELAKESDSEILPTRTSRKQAATWVGVGALIVAVSLALLFSVLTHPA